MFYERATALSGELERRFPNPFCLGWEKGIRASLVISMNLNLDDGNSQPPLAASVRRVYEDEDEVF